MRCPDERAELIGLIYEAALDQRVWPLVADRLADALHATVGQLGSYDSTTHERSAIYNEFFLPHGLVHTLGTVLLNEGHFLAMLAVYRPERMGAFETADKELLAWLIPHLQRAVQLNRRLIELETARMASAELLDRLRQASLLADAACRVLFANRVAEEILADRIGLHRGADGVLRAGRHMETTALHKLVAGAAGRIADGEEGAGGRLRLSRGEDRTPLSVLVIPLRAETNWLAPRHPAAMLFVTDPERTCDPTAASLRADFGLTRMEAALALEVLDGKGLKVAARRLGVSPTTARTHLTAVFDKTGVRRQAELVRVLLQSDGALREE